MVEDTAVWRKSSYSGGNNGNCVEVALTADETGVRDSKNPAGPVVRADLHALLAAVKHGEFDR
jgi:hypothetical protein